MTLLPNLKISPGPNPVPRNQQHTQKLASKQWKKHRPGIVGHTPMPICHRPKSQYNTCPPHFQNPIHRVSGIPVI